MKGPGSSQNATYVQLFTKLTHILQAKGVRRLRSLAALSHRPTDLS